MLPIKLQGDSLAARHKQLNTLVNEAFLNTESRHVYKDVEESSDADRLFKIELALKSRDAAYILATLESDDMLYVSRALKASWLVTDEKYAHIINPEHLYTVLYPQMYNRAIRKLEYLIRQYLRSEGRCELFFKYHKNELNDIKSGVAFLPYCSKEFIVSTVNEHNIFIDGALPDVLRDNVFKGIVDRFYDLAETILKLSGDAAVQLLSTLSFLAISQMELYLYLLEKFGNKYSRYPQLSKNLSKKIAKKQSRKIFERLDVYLLRVNLFSMADVWSKETIENFIDVVSKSKEDEVCRWFSEYSVKDLLRKLSEEDRNNIIKKYFRLEEEIKDKRDQYIYVTKYGNTYICPSNLHKWYERVPFETAFADIKQLIRATMSVEDRSTLLLELIKLSEEDQNRLYLVLHYYFTTHMNEQKMYKIRFLDSLVKSAKVYRFNEQCWELVNDLLISLETYGNENYSNYNEVIVFHDILNNKQVPEVIMDKYGGNHHSQQILEMWSSEEIELILNYLLTHFEHKCKTERAKIGITRRLYDCINNFISILYAWQKCVLDYPFIISAITEMMLSQQNEFYYSKDLSVFVVCYNLLNGLETPNEIMEIYLNYGYSNKVRYINEENEIKIFNLLVTDFETRTVCLSEEDICKNVIDLTNSFIMFLHSSKKPLADFPCLISIMKKIVIAVPNSLAYPTQRSARRLLFDVSLLMSQGDDVLVDIIKHDVTVLSRHFEKFEKIMIAKKICYKKLLKKLLAYFDNDYAKYFQNSFKKQLKYCEKPSTENDYVAYVNANVSLIYKKRPFLEVIQEYLPKNHKVEWSKEDLCVINIRKYIAKNLYQVRPKLDMETIYEFAKGDYLQYALPSLLSTSIDAPANLFMEKILPKLLNSPVSLQKHGIRLAFLKLHLDQVCPIIKRMWSKTKNVSIRNSIFEFAFTLLTKEVKEDNIDVLWQLIKAFVTQLQEDEERTILLYNITHLDSLPQQVRSESCQICYREMERIKDKIDWNENRRSLLRSMHQLLSKGMDPDFVSKILLEIFEQLFQTDYFHEDNANCEFRDLLAKFLLLGNNTEQQSRYENVARPIFAAIIRDWNKSHSKVSVQSFFKNVLGSLTDANRKSWDGKKDNTNVFLKLFDQLQTVCTIEEHFDYHLTMKLLIIFNEAIQKTDFSKNQQVTYKECGLFFSQASEKLLNEMVNSYFPSIALSYRVVLFEFMCAISPGSILFLSFVDNLIKADGQPHNVLLGVYLYHKIEMDSETFEKDSGGYYSQVTSRIMSIDSKEISFHMNTKLL